MCQMSNIEEDEDCAIKGHELVDLHHGKRILLIGKQTFDIAGVDLLHMNTSDGQTLTQ